MPRHNPSPSATLLLAAALAAAAWCPGIAHAQETLEGTLERGPTHSALWAISPESGDLVGQVFANTSQAGLTILAHCLPGLHCVAEGAHTAAPPDGLAETLPFSAQPSGWLLVTQADGARMQPSLPMAERQLRTRHGQLTITDDYLLLLNGRPVLTSQPQVAPRAPEPAPSARTLLERINAWWQHWWGQVRGKLLALLGRTPAPPPPAAQPPAEPVQGNAALHVVAHFELEQGPDIVLLQDTGGTACPALYRFATLTPQGIAVTPEFGTCSDLSAVTLESTPDGTQEPRLIVVGALDPAARGQKPRLRLHHFVLRQGQVEELAAQR